MIGRSEMRGIFNVVCLAGTGALLLLCLCLPSSCTKKPTVTKPAEVQHANKLTEAELVFDSILDGISNNLGVDFATGEIPKKTLSLKSFTYFGDKYVWENSHEGEALGVKSGAVMWIASSSTLTLGYIRELVANGIEKDHPSLIIFSLHRPSANSANGQLYAHLTDWLILGKTNKNEVEKRLGKPDRSKDDKVPNGDWKLQSMMLYLDPRDKLRELRLDFNDSGILTKASVTIHTLKMPDNSH
jgi:hypothetical protein